MTLPCSPTLYVQDTLILESPKHPPSDTTLLNLPICGPWACASARPRPEPVRISTGARMLACCAVGGGCYAQRVAAAPGRGRGGFPLKGDYLPRRDAELQVWGALGCGLVVGSGGWG